MHATPIAENPDVVAMFEGRSPYSLRVTAKAIEAFARLSPAPNVLPATGLRGHVASALEHGKVRVSSTGWLAFEHDGFRTVINPTATAITDYGPANRARPLSVAEFALVDPATLPISARTVASVRSYDPSLSEAGAEARVRTMLAEAIATGGVPDELTNRGGGVFRTAHHRIIVNAHGTSVTDFRAKSGFASVRTLPEILLAGFDSLTVGGRMRREVERSLGLDERPDDGTVRQLVAGAFTAAAAGGFYGRGDHGTHCARLGGVQYRISSDGTVLVKVIAVDRIVTALDDAA
jgi:hypothetical protein